MYGCVCHIEGFEIFAYILKLCFRKLEEQQQKYYEFLEKEITSMKKQMNIQREELVDAQEQWNNEQLKRQVSQAGECMLMGRR